MKRSHFFIGAAHLVLALVIPAVLCGGLLAYAAPSEEELGQLESEIKARKNQIENINRQMDEYRKQINELSDRTAGLINDIAFIENQIAIGELDVELTRVEIESRQLELQLLEERIRQESLKIEGQRELIKDLLFSLNKTGDVEIVEVIFSSGSISQLFEEIAQLQSLNETLSATLEASKISKARLADNKASQEQQLEQMIDLEKDLQLRIASFERSKAAKDILIAETQASESEYHVLLGKLRGEQQAITNQVSTLQSQLQDKIAQRQKEEGTVPDREPTTSPTTMVNPLPSAILTARFHDPTYPFRHLFEHSGMDLAAPMGTPIVAAGDGIVAWTKVGQSYGNYAMVIHQNGYATLYAHMSAFNVVADQYVEAGQVIGFVGSTGFSTGPHLHFELRANGIPVNPAQYIPSMPK